jgi:hypothetical protein
MPSAYFVWTMLAETRAPRWTTFVVDSSVEHRDVGMEGDRIDIVSACMLLTAALASVYVAVAWLTEKALSAIAG